MTQRNYIAIARALNDVVMQLDANEEMDGYDVLRAVVNRLCYIMKEDNQRFDAVKFNKAVYKESMEDGR